VLAIGRRACDRPINGQLEDAMSERQSVTAAALKKYESELLEDWMSQLRSSGAGRDGRITDHQLQLQAQEFIALLQEATETGASVDSNSPHWQAVSEFLEGVSRSRVEQGFTSDQTATFLFSFKRPLFERLRLECGDNTQLLAEEVWAATELLDQMGLLTVRAFQRTREDVITRQQQEMLELSTPVVKLWDGVLALPMIGTLDSARTQIVMETLLQRIVETGSETAIIDITGVPTVDTLVAQHLLKTVTAIRLMGADCIISGVRPQIAQTIVHLGVDLQGVTTKASLADALALALRRRGFVVSKAAAALNGHPA
jgi:rsbT co-antagonist protein RsbR